ncbi:MAG: SUF system Fe-S cluster assembly protein [Dongiaceae bacterium]
MPEANDIGVDRGGGEATTAARPPLDEAGIETLRGPVIDAIRTVYDPEIPVNIYELGLIYELDIDADANVQVKMTLTAPGCPVAGTMPGMVKEAIQTVANIGNVDVELVWEPAWDRSRMSEIAQLELGMI